LLAALKPPIAIAGMGVEGRDTFRFLRAQGVTALRVFDRELAAQPPPELAEARIPVFGDADWLAQLPQCGTVFRSPGIRPDHPALQAARAAGARITSATTLFLTACPSPVIGVTGTLGKGTTATLIHEALRAVGIPSRLAGNIGLNPLAFLADVQPNEPVVLELSSFQLMDLGAKKPQVAVILRTTEDHLDWHRDQAEYHAAKAGMLAPRESGQIVIYCADADGSRAVVASRLGDAIAYSLLHPVREGIGIGIDSEHVFRYRAGAATPLPQLERLALPGRFNLENAAAALLAAEAVLALLAPGAAADSGIAPALAAIAAFPGLPHRLERVGVVRAGTGRGGGSSMGTGREVACYNDSYATRPDATLGALSAFDQPLALILGGSEKHAHFAALAEAVCRHPSLKRVLLIGATAERLAGEIRGAAARLGVTAPPLEMAPGLAEACSHGVNALRETGGVLLLSPACASFGLFPNYKVRGEKFREWVNNNS
jgi:UDP-N-acetylmuramoylalanine--D-glutamate ligase